MTRDGPAGAHEADLADAFDGQAERFERALVQSDREALERLVRLAAFPAGASIADAGCGPGLVAEAFLEAGYGVRGFDLSREMVERARQRNARFGARAIFEKKSIFDVSGPFDGVVSRHVLHHTPDPLAFVRHQASLLRPGGVLVLSDHLTDPRKENADWHGEIERRRDRTHTRNLTGGEIVDMLASAGLVEIELREETFELDFDEWFDRGTPTDDKDTVRRLLLSGSARGFAPTPEAGKVRLACVRGHVRGVKPARVSSR